MAFALTQDQGMAEATRAIGLHRTQALQVRQGSLAPKTPPQTRPVLQFRRIASSS